MSKQKSECLSVCVSVGGWLLECVGIIVGTVLCICQGVGCVSIGWFWATFPFWCPIAFGMVMTSAIFVVAMLLAILTVIGGKLLLWIKRRRGIK